MAGVIRLQGSLLRRLVPTIQHRLISTSKKNSDSAAVEAATHETASPVVKKNWMSYGFDVKSEDADQNAMHSIMFASITLCIVLGGFILTYVPDYNLRDWSQREAFLELARREAAGLPLVDPNLIDPKKIKLPTDEELGDQEIII